MNLEPCERRVADIETVRQTRCRAVRDRLLAQAASSGSARISGEWNGETRILGRKTAEYMLTNQLGPEVKNLIANADPTRADYGFGLGLSVRTEAGRGRVIGSVGDFSWPGASGTSVSISASFTPNTTSESR